MSRTPTESLLPDPALAPSCPVPKLLLFASAPVAARLAEALTTGLGCELVCIDDAPQCEQMLQNQTFSLILLEDCIPCAQPAFYDTVQRNAGSALVLELNFGITNAPRVLRAIRAAEERRRQDMQAARAVALHGLRNELSSSLTGLLLESELAMHSNRSELGPALSNLRALAELLYRQMRP